MGYNFRPMMPFYNRILSAPTEWLMSRERRKLIAKAIKLCKAKHGRRKAIEFRDALLGVGCIYPFVHCY